jgi:hypothetical protein
MAITPSSAAAVFFSIGKRPALPFGSKEKPGDYLFKTVT